jgi:hypothetical protein
LVFCRLSLVSAWFNFLCWYFAFGGKVMLHWFFVSLRLWAFDLTFLVGLSLLTATRR